MKFLEPDPQFSQYGIRAMVMVANAAENGLGQAQKSLLAAAQKLVLHTEIDIEKLPTITPEELAKHCSDPAIARQFIRGMVVMSLVEGPASPAQLKLIRAFAKALNVEEPAVNVIKKLTEKELLLFKLDFLRRSQAVDVVGNQYHEQGGIIGIAKAIFGASGLIEDPVLASKFRRLGDLPENTLGNHYYHHCADNHFAFPGEKAGFPVGAVFHDFGHVLGGYKATQEGELQVGAFQAGYGQREDSFFTFLSVLLTYSAGINMVPVKHQLFPGLIGKEGLAEKILIAFQRGAAMKVDLANNWDFWAYVELPIETVRQEFAVPPLPEFAAVDEPLV